MVDEEKVAETAKSAQRSPSNSSSGLSTVGDGAEQTKVDRLDSRVLKQGEQDPFAELPEEERDVLKAQIDQPEVAVSFGRLFRFADGKDKVILILSCIGSIIGGAILPLMTIVFGALAGTFQQFFFGSPPLSAAQLSSTIAKYTLYFVYMAIAEFFMQYTSTVGLLVTGEHITGNIRKKYLQAILRQNIGYFDKLGAGEITTRITADTNLIQDGISHKIGLSLTAVASFVSAFVIAFIKSWKLTLILTSTVVAITLTMGLGSRWIIKYNKASIQAYASGGTVAEEALSSIRNSQAFGTQNKLALMYDVHLTVAEKFGLKHKLILGYMLGCMMCIVYLNYGLAFWQGSRFISSGESNLQSVLTVLMAIMIGAFSLGNVAPHAQAFATAVSASSKIYSTIDRNGPLDSASTEGEVPDHVDGTIELRNVKHRYPSRPEMEVVRDFSLVVPAGKVTALVGSSGSGKSTIIGLVERFYDPTGGEVLLDGRNIKDLNLKWLRQQISLVQQEPVLFGTTIFENVAHGLIGTEYEEANQEKKAELVYAACEMANAKVFIESLPEGYETNVGERGFLLSGGQKQRIAIARAVVSNPKILLLDEATSALDTKSEGVVQQALERASQGRTTIVIAHRLSTVKTADKIVVMATGVIVEEGSHDQLIDSRGAYFNLVEAQRFVAEKEEAADPLLKEQTNEKDPVCDEDPDDEILLKKTQTSKSKSSLALANKPKENHIQYSLGTLIKLIFSFNQEEKGLMLLGLTFSMIAGAGYPVQSVFFAKAITAVSPNPNDPRLNPAQATEIRRLIKKDTAFWSAMYLMLAIVQFLSYSGQGWAFAKCSERLVHRCRDRAFRAMLRQDIAFFDKDENTSGALTSFLSTQTTFIAGLSGATLGTLAIVSTTLFGGIGVSIGFGWKLGLVCTATVPILLGCGYCRFALLAHFERRSKAAYESSASYACEATAAIRTVASLTREEDVVKHYYDSIEAQEKRSLKSVLKSSIFWAASQSLTFLAFALGFWYGGTLLASREYGMFQFFVCFTAIIFGAQSAGTIFSFAPDMGKAKSAASDMKTLFDRKPEIDTWSDDGENVPDVEGYIEFRDVHFRYPTRPEQPVLRGLNLSVKPGQYIALCGPSGCGKSTTVALMERFYDPLTGGVFVDGKDIASLHLNQYRSHIALVSQEPTLYQGTIRENILLGSAAIDDANITEEDIIQATKDANIYDFIQSLPEGFNTICGSKGALLSGGQKQRIAIARALIRKPKILLLDEATSALDSESEKVVQHALDVAAKGRTTIAVAHRLSTIQGADMIYVFDQGRVVENGTHSELMRLKGKYHELVNLQSLGKNH